MHRTMAAPEGWLQKDWGWLGWELSPPEGHGRPWGAPNVGPPGGGPGSLTASLENSTFLSEPQCGTPQRLPLKSPLARGKHRPRLTATAEKQLFTLEKQNRLKQQEAAGKRTPLAPTEGRPEPCVGQPGSARLQLAFGIPSGASPQVRSLLREPRAWWQTLQCVQKAWTR